VRVIRGLEMSFFVLLAAFVVFLLPASNIYADTAPFFIGGVNIKPVPGKQHCTFKRKPNHYV